MPSVDVRYSIEAASVGTLLEQALDLLHAHHAEVSAPKGMLPFHVDWTAVLEIEAQHRLHTLVAKVDGKIVGYHLLWVMFHPHSMLTRIAQTEALYVSPEHRSKGIGLALIREGEVVAERLGARGMFVHAPRDGRLERVLPRIGYTEHSTMFVKEL